MTLKMTLKGMAFLVVALMTAQVCAEEPQVMKTQKDKLNYSIGVTVIRNFKQQGLEIDLDAVVKGMKDAHSGGKLLMTDGEIHKTMTSFHKELRLKQTQSKLMAAADNKKEGDAFLAENMKKEGVMALPSGLQYKILKAGSGKMPTDADTVECNYRGTFINGTEFDSSYRTGKPATLKVKGVIPGWQEALKLMPVGSKWQLFIPPQLAYGERGSGPIGPNATLIFDLELLAIK
jgi:FKBP-type peptidyl-prolyl cis-trans isomerase FklB